MYRYLAIGFFAICLEALAFTGRLSGLSWFWTIAFLAFCFISACMAVIFMHAIISKAEEKDGI